MVAGGLVAKWLPTLATPWTVGPPGSFVHRISRVRTLEWVAISSSRVEMLHFSALHQGTDFLRKPASLLQRSQCQEKPNRQNRDRLFYTGWRAKQPSATHKP